MASIPHEADNYDWNKVHEKMEALLYLGINNKVENIVSLTRNMYEDYANQVKEDILKNFKERNNMLIQSQNETYSVDFILRKILDKIIRDDLENFDNENKPVQTKLKELNTLKLDYSLPLKQIEKASNHNIFSSTKYIGLIIGLIVGTILLPVIGTIIGGVLGFFIGDQSESLFKNQQKKTEQSKLFHFREWFSTYLIGNDKDYSFVNKSLREKNDNIPDKELKENPPSNNIPTGYRLTRKQVTNKRLAPHQSRTRIIPSVEKDSDEKKKSRTRINFVEDSSSEEEEEDTHTPYDKSPKQ